MSLNIQTIQLFEHPSFPGKLIIVFQAFEHLCMDYYSNIRTPTPCGARSGVIQRLQDLDSLYGSPTEFAERLLAFNSLWGARMSSSILQASSNVY